MNPEVLLVAITVLYAAAASEPQMQDIAFTATVDNTEQRYILILPEAFTPAETHDVLIALHGHGSDRWQFAKDPRDECRAARDAAAEHKMIYVSPDYRAKTSWMGPKAEADVVQIIGDLKRDYRVGKVYLCGGSMGGTSALAFAVRHPELLDGVASMNGTANLVEYEGFQDAIAESYGGDKKTVPDEYRNRSAEFFPERLMMPIGITAGGKDDIVPSASAVRLAKALERLGRKVKLVYREEGGHETHYADAKTILDFVLAQ